MDSPVSEYLADVLANCRDLPDDAAPADYIPELAEVDPELFGLALTTSDGVTYATGDADVRFSIQSISKAFNYAMAIRDRGLETVLSKIGVEPSGEAFNELSLEDDGTQRPLNPMINAGAMTAHSLVGEPDDSPEEICRRSIEGLGRFAGRELTVDEEVFTSEMEHAHRNLSIAHMLRSYGIIDQDPHDVVEGYTRACAVEVTTKDLSVMAATLANNGTNPVTGEEVVPPDVVQHTLSVMLSCGMYDAAGDWTTTVGIPAKSGVGGGIIGALPGQLGIATYSPPLDEHGNSVRGIQAFTRLSREMGLHLMKVPPLTRSVIRSHKAIELEGKHAFMYRLQGPLRFSSMEQFGRLVADHDPEHRTVIIDTDNVSSIDRTAMEMLETIVDGMTEDGCTVWLTGEGAVNAELERRDDSFNVADSIGDLRL